MGIRFRTNLQEELPVVKILMQGEKDDKIIAVCADDPEFRHYKDIKELPPHRLAEIRRFFEDCILSLIYYVHLLLDFVLMNYLFDKLHFQCCFHYMHA